ncbi:MAG: hypothetical protein H6978_01745 [Gammaproteobacteria bacterium]|nr:hypothetical protein [Gammaproteobacteria bacterium]
MRYTDLHIDVARFATDDFNPFHDRRRWQQLAGNPFGGPIVLGFQLTTRALHETLLSHVDRATEFRYVNIHVTFANAVGPDEPVAFEVKDAKVSADGAVLSHRIALRTPRGLALTGHIRFAHAPPTKSAPPVIPLSLNRLRDRMSVPGTEYFLKRKYMSTANAKNFLLGCGIEPAVYIDELADHVDFMPMFPASLLSCALLERGAHRGDDFLREPMVYSFHDIWLDRAATSQLRSNDTLNMLVSGGHGIASAHTTRAKRAQRTHHCVGYTGWGAEVFNAQIGLVPLSALGEGG